MTPVMGGFESHRVIPLSLTFDHRATTGGEAARFLKAMLDDLALAR
jgi:pyruvate dehydrogenase E2 component (dihydrolipoamide acetyltransferase)